MLQFQLTSDTHVNWQKQWYRPTAVAPVLVVAGDISDSVGDSVRWLQEIQPDFEAVFCVLGNHDHLSGKYEDNVAKFRDKFAGTSVKFLENDVVDYKGVRIAGCTLWTNIPIADRYMISRALVEYGKPSEGSKLGVTPDFTCDRHAESVAFLRGTQADLVITHHLPSQRSIVKKYKDSPLNSAFFTSLDPLVAQSSMWVHGHTHESRNYHIGDCQVLCNPRGYAGSLNPNYTEEEILLIP